MLKNEKGDSMKWCKRYKEQSERLRIEKDFWKRALILEIEDNIADTTGAVSQKEIRDRMREHENRLQQALKEVQ